MAFDEVYLFVFFTCTLLIDRWKFYNEVEYFFFLILDLV